MAASLLHKLHFSGLSHRGLKWTDAGGGGRAGLPHCPKLMLLCSSPVLSVLVRSMQRARSGGGGKCQAPADLHQQFGVEHQLQAALFLYHRFSGACSRRARSESQSAVSLCDLETQELNIWPEAAFGRIQGYGFWVWFTLYVLLQLCLLGGLVWLGRGRGWKAHKEKCAGLPINCLHVMLGRIF